MRRAGIFPEGEALRKAVQWLAERGDHSLAAIEEAARRFDLSPAEEDFLIRHLATKPDAGPGGQPSQGA